MWKTLMMMNSKILRTLLMKDELEPERKKKKSEFVLLMVPPDIFNNSGLVQSDDGPQEDLSKLQRAETLNSMTSLCQEPPFRGSKLRSRSKICRTSPSLSRLRLHLSFLFTGMERN